MRTNTILTFVTLTVMCFLGNMIATKLRAQQSAKSYSLTCPQGTVLKGRKDWTDQQPEGTAFAGFTCCPESHPDFHYINENYFCCPAGTGAYCMSNACNCKSAALKGGVIPEIVKLSG